MANYYGPELMHYGVKGMKWGVRKQGPSSGGTRAKRSGKAVSNATAKKTVSRIKLTDIQKKKVKNFLATAGAITIAAAVIGGTMYVQNKASGGRGMYNIAGSKLPMGVGKAIGNAVKNSRAGQAVRNSSVGQSVQRRRDLARLRRETAQRVRTASAERDRVRRAAERARAVDVNIRQA